MARPGVRAEPRERSVGVVLSITPAGLCTARASGAATAPEGTSVSDRTGRFRGRVLRVFGPVTRPYLSIRPRRPPTPAEATALIGTTLRRDGEG